MTSGPTWLAPLRARSLQLPRQPPRQQRPVRASRHRDDAIKEKVLEIVAEKTGYPKDMLDLDLDLEADLGIDTVKQAEMFAAVRAAFNIPRDQNLKLRDFPTLAHVIHSRASGRVADNSSSEQEHNRAERSQSHQRLRRRAVPRIPCSRAWMPRIDSTPRAGARLAPAAGVCKPTGVTLGRGSPRRHHARQRRGGRCPGTNLQAMGVEVLAHPGHSPMRRRLPTGSRIGCRLVRTRRLLAPRA